jgi:hypothetical protein
LPFVRSLPFLPPAKKVSFGRRALELIRVFQDTDKNGFLDGGFKNGVLRLPFLTGKG